MFSSLYYSPLLLGNIWRAIDPGATAGAEPSIAKVVVETARTLIITFVLPGCDGPDGSCRHEERCTDCSVAMVRFLSDDVGGSHHAGRDALENRGYPFR